MTEHDSDKGPAQVNSPLDARSARKQRERTLLRTIYDDANFASVVHDDCPDFVLSRHHEPAFGVEVTDLFDTETGARLQLLAHYVGTLLAGGDFIHREDAERIRRTTVTITASDGTVKHENVPALMRDATGPQQWREALRKCHARKHALSAGYAGDLSHVNLIIGDRFSPVEGGSREHEYCLDDVLSPEMRSDLLQSRFREVFIVQTTRDGRTTYRPLQQLLVAEAFFLFVRACALFPGEEDGGAQFQFDEVVALFAGLCGTILPTVYLGRAGKALCAVYRGAGVGIGEGGIVVYDFADRQAPAAIPAPPLRFDDAQIHRLQESYVDLTATSSFSTALWFEAFSDEWSR